MPAYLTDLEYSLRPNVRSQYPYWLDFTLTLETRAPTYRRWFVSIEARNAYIVTLPANCTVTNHGEA